ncbi:MAG: SDR family oxidoreductase [Deltaproteobacteria bacterium]|nr:SDR family oxidoreductase [Deltaproteobacteria bacterium]MBW1955045.1 SDR family oxidoreductase [Deltaproteobacteria bacterium]MBW2040779.1 SDR family oxidoreductase [Deltaproteobacteria bacterium]MBW2131183.1 SDR family oxidoreductase [Deltaproteobacteria bacterium]
MKIEGKVALVLGSVKGIGKGIAEALARKGAKIAAVYWDWETHLETLKKDLEAAGAEPFILKVDLRETKKIPAMVAAVAAHFGGIHILINNIERGGWPVVHGPYVQEQWDLETETTLRAKWWVFNAALPHLKASGEGVVVNLSSIAGIVGRTGPAAHVFNDGYAAANRGVSLFTETWARMGAPQVRVNEIMLGFVETRHGPGTRGWGVLTKAQKDDLLHHTLMGRVGSIQDVVKAVEFIIEEAPFMTGSVLRLDGGYVLGGEPVPPIPRRVL